MGGPCVTGGPFLKWGLCNPRLPISVFVLHLEVDSFAPPITQPRAQSHRPAPSWTGSSRILNQNKLLLFVLCLTA